MRSRLNILVAAAVAALVVPQLAMAESVEDQLRLMNDRMSQMEDQLQATQDELEASQEQVERQESVIEKAGLDRESRSGLAGFYDQVNISGWLAASYAFNFNGPPNSSTIADQNFSQLAGASINGGFAPYVAPLHPDHNSFSVDQLWFEIEKPVTEESRGGFRADLLWGKTGGLLGGIGTNRLFGGNVSECLDTDLDIDTDDCEGDSASDFNLYQAYVQYLTPFGPTMKAGKFGTLVGSEVVGTVYNYNVTRGIVWTLLQPINHYGLLFDGQTDGGFVYSAGIINSIRAIDPDSNNKKSGIFRVGYSAETWEILNTIIYGHEEYGTVAADGKNLLYDLVINWNPSENFSSWINFDYAWQSLGGAAVPEHPRAWGLAAAGRYAFTDRLGFALRGEVAQDYNFFFGSISDASGADPRKSRVWSITGTVDYELTDNLVIKAEARYDKASCTGTKNVAAGCDQFVNSTGTTGVFGDTDPFNQSDQWLGIVEATYQF